MAVQAISTRASLVAKGRHPASVRKLLGQAQDRISFMLDRAKEADLATPAFVCHRNGNRVLVNI
jgi:hypothetical protein